MTAHERFEQRLMYAGGGDGGHARVNGALSLIGSDDGGVAQDDHGAAERSGLRGGCGAEESNAGFAERGREMKRTAIDTDHGGSATGSVDETGERRLMNANVPKGG